MAARGMTASMMSSAPGRLGHEEQPLPCLDQRGARLGRQDVDVERTEVAEQRAQLFDVLVEAGLR